MKMTFEIFDHLCKYNKVSERDKLVQYNVRNQLGTAAVVTKLCIAARDSCCQ